MDWTAAALRARHHLGARKRTLSEVQSRDLIDFIAERGTVTSAQMQLHGSANFVRTILGHVTQAIHGGGWYHAGTAGKVYITSPLWPLVLQGPSQLHASMLCRIALNDSPAIEGAALIAQHFARGDARCLQHQSALSDVDQA